MEGGWELRKRGREEGEGWKGWMEGRNRRKSTGQIDPKMHRSSLEGI